jgi:hypothetical protein
MSQLWPLVISLIVVLVLVLALASRFKISARYDRKPREITPWSALDQGIDPTTQDTKNQDPKTQ